MAMERIPVIKTSDLSIGYILKGGQKKCVHDALDLNLYPGEVTCLLGLNGAGKSTTIDMLCTFLVSLFRKASLYRLFRTIKAGRSQDYRGIACCRQYRS